MRKPLFIFIALILLVALWFLMEPLVKQLLPNKQAANGSNGKVTVNPEDPYKGKTDAPITIVEFSSFTCENCRNSAAIMDQLLALYPDNLKIVWKDFPHDGAPASRAAVAGRCAQLQGKFWPYHDLLFANQDKLLTEETQIFEDLAAQVGLNTSQFIDCLNGNSVTALIQQNVQEGLDSGLTGVPYFDINNQQRVDSAISLGQWRQIIEAFK